MITIQCVTFLLREKFGAKAAAARFRISQRAFSLNKSFQILRTFTSSVM